MHSQFRRSEVRCQVAAAHGKQRAKTFPVRHLIQQLKAGGGISPVQLNPTCILHGDQAAFEQQISQGDRISSADRVQAQAVTAFT
jgi:hypothetical protein